MDDLFSDLEQAEKSAKQKKTGRKKKGEFDSALSETSFSDVARAAKKTTVRGKYWLRTLRLPPEYQELTRDIFKREVQAKSLADIERWIYTMGLIAYYQEGKRPEYQQESISRDISLPDIS